MANPLQVVLKRSEKLEHHLYGVFYEIFERLDLSLCETLSKQCYLFHQEACLLEDQGEDWKVTLYGSRGIILGDQSPTFLKTD